MQDSTALKGAVILILGVPAIMAFYNYGADRSDGALREGTGRHNVSTSATNPVRRGATRLPPQAMTSAVGDNGGLYGSITDAPKLASLDALRGGNSLRIDDAGGVKTVGAAAAPAAGSGSGHPLERGGPIDEALSDSQAEGQVAENVERMMMEARGGGAGGIQAFKTGSEGQKSFGSMVKSGSDGGNAAKRLIDDAKSKNFGQSPDSTPAAAGQRSASPGSGHASGGHPSNGPGSSTAGASGGGAEANGSGTGSIGSVNVPDASGIGAASANLAASASLLSGASLSGASSVSSAGGGTTASGGGGGGGGSGGGGGGGGLFGGSSDPDGSEKKEAADTPGILAELSAQAHKKYYACNNYQKVNECDKLNQCMGEVSRGLGELSTCMKGGTGWYGCWRQTSLQGIMALSPDMVSQRAAFKRRCTQGLPDQVVIYYDSSQDPPLIKYDWSGRTAKEHFERDVDQIFNRVESLLRDQ